MIHYQRIENALDICSEHVHGLDPTNIKDKELETFLVAGLIVLIVSEYEEYLEFLFFKKADMCGDIHAANYIKKSLSQKFRSPDLSKINETLCRFDRTYKDSFMNNIVNSPEHAAWDSLMAARHAVVHKKSSLNLTLRELSQKYPLTKQIIANVETVLGV
ncbi:MAG: HEPN domain-containing protein [Methylococcales bacterium]